MEKYLDITKAFAETMRDKYIAPGDKGNHLLFIARDSVNTIGGLIGRPKETAESLFGICMENEQVRDVVLAVARRLSRSVPERDNQQEPQDDYIVRVGNFADEMKERYLDNDKDNSLVILAGNKEGVQLIAYGDKDNRLISMASAIKTEQWFEYLVKAALSLATFTGDYEEIIKKYKEDADDQPMP